MFEGGECPNSCRSMKESGSTWLQGHPSGEMGLAIECRMPRGTGRSHTGKTWNKSRTLACSRQYLPLFWTFKTAKLPGDPRHSGTGAALPVPKLEARPPIQIGDQACLLVTSYWRSATASRPQLH